MATWGTISPKIRNRSPQLGDFVDLVEFIDGGDYKPLRPLGPIWSFAQHWFAAISNAGKEYRTARICLNYNSITENFEDHDCPYCIADGEGAVIDYIGNVIDRKLQIQKPINRPQPQPEETKPQWIGPPDQPDSMQVYLKTKGSPTWTPIRILRATATMATKLKGFTDLNTRRNPQTSEIRKFPISDLNNGMDIQMKYNKNLAYALRFDIQRDQASSITKEERHYHFWRLDVMRPFSLEVARKDWEALSKRIQRPTSEEETTETGDYYHGHDTSDLEIPVSVGGFGDGLAPGIVGKARINGQIFDARIIAVSPTGTHLKIENRSGQTTIVPISDFRPGA